MSQHPTKASSGRSQARVAEPGVGRFSLSCRMLIASKSLSLKNAGLILT
jgi:hypothetical protein